MSAYLRWAIAHYPAATYDLATSGTREAPVSLWLDPSRLVTNDPKAVLRAREKIAELNGVRVEEVLLTSGAAHAIFLAAAAAILGSAEERGDARADVLVEHPHYEPLRTSAAFLHSSVRTFDVLAPSPPHDFVARVLGALRPETKLVVLSNLHNPTGHRRSDADLAAIAKAIAKQNAFLLVDEIYAPFDALNYGPSQISSAKRLGENVLAASSLTKTLGLGSHRLGWFLANEDVIERTHDIVLSTVGFLPLVHAEMLIHALEAKDALVARAKKDLVEKRALVRNALSTLPGLTFSNPDEGLFGFAWYEDGRDVSPLLDRALQEEGVIVAPGRFFGVPSGFRISWSSDLEVLKPGLERLLRVLGTPQARHR